MANSTFLFQPKTLCVAIAGALFGTAASGQTNIPCDVSSGGLSCSSSADIAITVDPSLKIALQALWIGSNGNPDGTLTGNDTQGLTITNTGNLTLQPLQGNTIVPGPVFGLFSQMQAGNGVTSSNTEYGGNGGVAGQSMDQILSLTNHGDITMNLQGVTASGGAGLAAFSQGGAGGATSKDHNPGGAGGQSAGAAIVNTGNISATLAGTGRFAGIIAASNGGNGGDQYDGGANDGAGAGGTTVTNSGAVTVNWTWADGASAGAALYGVLAQTMSGNGGDSLLDGLGNGGAAGMGYAADLSAMVTLQSGGNVTVNQTGTPPAAGAGVAAIIYGGNGGNGLADEDGTLGGNGGNAGSINGSRAPVQINVTDASVSTTGSQLPALLASTRGGAGGGEFNGGSYSDRNGGLGGQAGDIGVWITTVNSPITLSTTGDYASGIQTLQLGGAGGAGGGYGGDAVGLGSSNAGNGGSGGDAGNLTIKSAGSQTQPISIRTTGNDSQGIYVKLQGGLGADGGQLTGTIGGGDGGSGGTGGSTGSINLTLTETSIATLGTNAFGILAQNLGNDGGTGATATTSFVNGGDGGSGGSTGSLSISTDANTWMVTVGKNAVGILAQTASGAGADGGDGNGQLSGADGDGGSGGTAGAITVTNGGVITTTGTDALGILAQSLAGAGGAGATDYGIFYSKGGSGGAAGMPGVITVTNTGTIDTTGTMAMGILAQSIGGSGGSAGTGGGLAISLGGDADTNPFESNASDVTVNASGTITTTGLSAIGVLAQSVGGGGGAGGTSQGFVSIGGSGGKGGSGGQVIGTPKSLTLTTGGDNAHGFVAQSIGGGGGNAGNADSLGLFLSVAVGQSGGDGGSGGNVTLNLSDSNIVTQGTKAAGLVGQSIGGGGGTGGQAFGYSIGAAGSVSVAVGGTGGTGGDGGIVSSQLQGGSIKTGQILQLLVTDACSAAVCLAANEMPIDSFGAVIQSIGGGGGLGGNATAKAAAIAIPVDTTGDQISVPISVAVGGTGGIAGHGGYVTFAAAQGAQIETRGQGAHGVLIQSIGGGGGAGGDSSSLAASLGVGSAVPDNATSLSLDVAVAVGANGGGGGDGNSVWSAVGGLISVNSGQATFTPDAAGTTPSTIATYGDYANGITAQSIGGGGGNAGFGSGNTQAFGTGTLLSANIGLGGTGGVGGDGGLVQVEVMPTGQIQTAGSGAIGVLAQSIGGGGGTSQGGSYNFVGIAKHASPDIDIKVGKTGGAGGAGGAVGVTVAGSINTYGGDAAGVQAQSIGGGGGQGGSAGSDGSADNPILTVLDGRVSAKDVLQDVYNKILGEPLSNYQLNLNLDVSVGGAGGAGNTGGAVTINLDPTGSIITAGDWSAGIFAQSIGGGGGKGGGALATGSGWADPTKVDLNANYSVGGDGGKGSSGGSVTTTLNGGSITTDGYAAAGIYAQSVGGGGGHAADGSDGFFGTLAVGIGYGGSGGGAGDAGVVNLSTTAGTPATTINTGGEAAFGAVLQSVGGGGGFAGAGTSIRVAVADDPIPAIKLSSGQNGNTSEGNGGTVTLQDNGAIAITTQGNNAFGVLAQSVGGGGGIVVNSQNQQTIAGIDTSIFGSAPEQGAQANGGAVTVNLGTQSQITTAGTGAHGLVAQSVGGGGGLIGLPGTSPKLTVDVSQAGTLTSGSGQGGNVSVTNNGRISASGAGAIGILAQSVSGAGGLKLAADGNTVYAGSGSSGSLSNATVEVTVAANAIVSSTAVDGIGIFAQNANGPGVTVTVDGSVSGGSDPVAGIGVWTDSTASSTLTVSSTGSITAGTAILATTSALNLNNAGIVTGSVNLNGGTMTNTGTFATGPEFVGASLENSGMVALGGREGTRWGYDRTRFATTTFNTVYTQTPTGTLQVGADFDKMASDFLTINGPATLNGALLVAPLALLPNRELAVLNVNGTQTGSLSSSDSPVVNYETRQDGNTTHVRAVGADFNADSMQLKRNATSLASHLQRDWDQEGSSELAKLYAVLDTSSRQGSDAYQNRLSDLSPGVALAPAAQMQLGMARFTGAMMSCPAFATDGALTGEQNCVWGQVTGRATNQDGGNGSSGFSYDSVTYQFGGQRQISPGWFLGGSVAYQNAHLSGDDHRVTGSGDLGYAGLVLKREEGPWTFSGSLGGGYGSYDLNRNRSIPNFETQATSTPDVYSLGARLRVARTFTEGALYVKPYVDLDVTYSRMSSYKESGDALRLEVAGSDQLVFGLAPTVEIGGRSELPRGAILRPFAYAGVSLLSENGWKTKSRLGGAAGSAGSFTTTMPTDNVVGRIGAGLQVMHVNGMDFKVQYDGEFASKGISHSGSLKMAYRF